MSLSDLFKVFSKRTGAQFPVPKPLPQSFRNRVFMRCRDIFAYDPTEFWTEMQVKLAYLHGRPRLSDAHSVSQLEDVLRFLEHCKDAHFLDFLEYIFDTRAHFRSTSTSTLVEDINEFFNQDDLPYALTDFVWTTYVDENKRTHSSTLTARPQVIRKDSQAIFSTAISPVLHLLRGAEFATANKEYLLALEDFRRGDYGDCLIKCGSTFESVLKVVCAQKRWTYSESDTASPLLKTVISNSGLDPFFEQPLILVATLRNRLSTAHGGGVAPRIVSASKAEYAINATAAAVLLLVAEARLS